jgi:hypothetical protein
MAVKAFAMMASLPLLFKKATACGAEANASAQLVRRRRLIYPSNGRNNGNCNGYCALRHAGCI